MFSMKRMRENTKTILWIVVISFVVTIFAVWGMDLRTGSSRRDPNIIGKVNGTPISRSQYQSLYNQMVQSVTANNTNKEISYAQKQMIENQAWNTIVYNILMKQEIKKLGIIVTDDEIMYYLRNTPPPEIQRYFLDDKGNFDFQGYQAALNNPDIDWTKLKQLARERLPLQKLQSYLQSMVHVSDAEIKRAYEEENTELSADYVEFPYENIDLGDYNPSSDEIQEYYNRHQDDYKEPERARLEIVALDIVPAKRDYEAAKYTINLVKDQLKGGEDFSSLAKSYSDAPTASSGGETGFIKRGEREKEFFDAIEKIKPGEVSDSVRTDSGYYLIKLLDKKSSGNGEPEYKTQEIFVKIAAGYETVDSLQNIINQVHEKAQAEGLKKAAEEMNIPLLSPKPFSRDSSLEGLGFVDKLNEFAFSSKAGSISGVIRDEYHFYVAHLIEHIAAALEPLSEVKEAIAKELEEIEKKNRGYDEAMSFYKAANEGDFASAAKSAGLEIKHLEKFHVSDDLERFGSYSTLATAAYTVQEGTITPPVASSGSYFVIKLLTREPFDTKDYQEKIAAIRNRLFQQKAQEYVNYWFSQVEKNNKIEDYRLE